MEITCRDYSHLGDCLFGVHFLRHLPPDININFHTLPRYHAELSAWITDRPNIHLLPPSKDDGVELWPGKMFTIDPRNRRKVIYPTPENYNQTLCDLYAGICRTLGLDCPIKSSAYLAFDHPALLQTNPMSKMSCDILLINGEPKSGQWDGDTLDRYARQLAELGARVITTKKIGTMPCTTDYDLNTLQIGQLSTRTPIILGIHTAPMIPCLNIWTISKAKCICVCDFRHHFYYGEKIINIKSVNELEALLKKIVAALGHT
jgi:hypothetical protein